MKGDFSRRTFRAENHYRGVLLQQGRVQLDADWNEQADIRDYLDRVTARDTFGPHGAPSDTAGMAIVVDNGVPTLTAGRYYVAGVLCENESPVPLFAQPDLPGVPPPGTNGRYVAYLDVWTEHVTAVERPELREVALGGPDTATRARTVWQVRLAAADPAATCAGLDDWEPQSGRGTGRLRARAQVPADGPAGPCVVPVTAGYRRLENQLYRVEIHDGTPAGPSTFVWSRENGSVVARLVTVTVDADEVVTLTIDAPGRDDRLGFAADQWIEVVDIGQTRRGEHGFLGRLASAVGTTLTVAEWRGGLRPPGGEPATTTVVRRWDSAGAVPVSADWIDLEDGVQVRFDAEALPLVLRTGDYWLIPARSADLSGDRADSGLAGDVEWPRDPAGEPLPRPPAGIGHAYAPIALLERRTGDDGNAVTWVPISDCRRLFPPLTNLSIAVYAGGDGQETVPGEPLPRPLEVAVASPAVPPPAATIRFTIDPAEPAGGGLAPTAEGAATATARSLDVPTGAGGVARAFWRPAADRTRPSQQVTARLLGRAGPSGAPIHFNANLSLAERVWFDPGECLALAGTDDVQAAIVALARARSLVAVGGDGQDARPDAVLQEPVTVQVRSDCGPVAGATVVFGVDSGGVAADREALLDDTPDGVTVEIDTDPEGVATCYWRLGDVGEDGALVQVLTARLQPAAPGGAPADVPPTSATFTANLDVSPQVSPGRHVIRVELVADERLLTTAAEVATDELTAGLRVVLDGPPDLVDESALAVTLDLPYPLTGADREFWFGDGAAGVFATVPVTLSASVSAEDPGSPPALLWLPDEAGEDFLGDRLFPALDTVGVAGPVRARLRLTGRDPDDAGDRALRTVDDIRGTDFTRWFWLIEQATVPEIVPRRGELFRLKSVRDALRLAVPRTALAAALPGGARLADGPDTDPAAATRAAGRAFRRGAERQLVLIVDERYAAAAAVIRDALAEATIPVRTVDAADPVDGARALIEAGERFDGVLTDAATAPRVAELGGFSTEIPL
nr:DUF6519 domain-containing protein [Micromonospora sp. DSM 115978]